MVDAGPLIDLYVGVNVPIGAINQLYGQRDQLLAPLLQRDVKLSTYTDWMVILDCLERVPSASWEALIWAARQAFPSIMGKHLVVSGWGSLTMGTRTYWGLAMAGSLDVFYEELYRGLRRLGFPEGRRRQPLLPLASQEEVREGEEAVLQGDHEPGGAFPAIPIEELIINHSPSYNIRHSCWARIRAHQGEGVRAP